MQKIKQATASAPGKLMVFGEHAVVFGKPCIVTAVNQRVYVTVSETSTAEVKLYAPDVQVDNYTLLVSNLDSLDIPKGAKFIYYAIKNFYNKYQIHAGLNIETRSDFSSSFGFGSSSAVTVTVFAALAHLFTQRLTKKELFEIAYQTILDVQGLGSGFDIAAAIWGGTIFFQNKGEIVRPLHVQNIPLIVGYTGVKADTVTLVKHVQKLREQKPEYIDEIFAKISDIALKAEQHIENQDWPAVGLLMNENEVLLEKLKVGSTKLSTLIQAAVKHGAYGAKLSGAGGGDCMIAMSDKNMKKRVEEGITSSGGEIMRVEIGAEGVRMEKV